MDKQKYNNYPLAISQILGLIEANDIAIPSSSACSTAVSTNLKSSSMSRSLVWRG